MKRFSRILACTDFSDVGNRAVEMAFGLVHDENASVLIAHILDQPPMPNPMYAHYVSHAGWEPEEFEKARGEADKALLALIPSEAASLGITVETCTPHGPPAEEILRLAKEMEAQVVVMGTHGRTGLERFLLGSVTERVVRMADSAVMVVH